MFAYIERTPQLADVLVSGGDCYNLSPAQLLSVGQRLLAIPHILRIRFASKGLAVCPSRLLDPDDSWAEALIQLSEEGREADKGVSLHTHFNHPAEITWVTEYAARRLFRHGVTVRNQTVLLQGVNHNIATMEALIRRLAALNIQPVRFPLLWSSQFVFSHVVDFPYPPAAQCTAVLRTPWSAALRTFAPISPLFWL